MKKTFLKSDLHSEIIAYEVTARHPEWGNYQSYGYVYYTDIEKADDFNFKTIAEDIVNEIHGLYFEYEVVLIKASRLYHTTHFFKGTCKEDLELVNYNIKRIDNI